jgi:hypothetical protein
VTVAAEELKVFEAVVAAVPVYVVQFHAEWLPHPAGDSAALAAIFLEAFLDQAELDVPPVASRARN